MDKVLLWTVWFALMKHNFDVYIHGEWSEDENVHFPVRVFAKTAMNDKFIATIWDTAVELGLNVEFVQNTIRNITADDYDPRDRIRWELTVRHISKWSIGGALLQAIGKGQPASTEPPF